jgi:uncharacterized protein YndB with AHSA1/START domain
MSPVTEVVPALRLRRRLEASPERVFQALTDPARMRLWWGPEGASATEVEVDLRPGGAFRIVIEGPDRARHVVGGVYREIDPPRRIVHSWCWEGSPEESTVTLAIEPDGTGAVLVVTHERLPHRESRNAHEAGWTSCLGKLEKAAREGLI